MIFYGQYTPSVDQLLYEKYFKDKRNGFFIECGALSNNEVDAICDLVNSSNHRDFLLPKTKVKK